MQTATFRASPAPYSKACDTFRPRIGQGAAIRTGLGGIALVHFFKPRAMLNSLVRQLSSEGRPSRIQNGLRHSSFSESGSIHIAYRDVVKLTHDAGAELVVKIIAAIRNLRVYRLHPFFLVSALRHGQRLFGTPVNALGFNFLARGQGGEVFQPKVNTDAIEWLTNASGNGNGIHLNHDVQEPVAPAVSGEVRAVFDLSFWQGAAIEHPERVASEAKGIALALEFTSLERNPSERLLPPVAQEGALFLAARLGVLLAYSVHSAGVQAKLFACAAGEFVQVKPGMPATAKAQRILLPVITEIPDEVASPALLVQQAS